MSQSLEFKASSLGADAGRGIFTTRAYAKGEAVCYYHGRTVAAEAPVSVTELAYSLYHRGQRIIGVMVPDPQHPTGVAQLINDGAMPSFPQFDNTAPLARRIKFIARRMCVYMVLSAFTCNVEQSVTDPLTFIAARPIATGEELFFSYGSKYWICDLRHRPTTPRKLERSLGYAESAHQEALTQCAPHIRTAVPEQLKPFMQLVAVVVECEIWKVVARLPEHRFEGDEVD